MPYREKRILSGDILEIEAYPISRVEAKKTRAQKQKESRKEQKNLNTKNSLKKFKRKVYCNFGKNSYFVTLTYRYELRPKKEIDVIRDLRNLWGKIRYRLGKSGGTELKYIAVIESGEDGTNFHVHVILESGLPITEIEKLWSKGTVMVSRLDDSVDGIERLAKYLSKEPKGSKRWMPSRNLKEPKIETTDNKIRSRKAMEDLARSVYDREDIERRYPGYEYVSGNAERNLLYGGDYISILMRRRN